MSVGEPLFGGLNRPPPSPPSLLGELVKRSGHGAAGVVPSWFVRPSAYGPRLCCLWAAGADRHFKPCRLVAISLRARFDRRFVVHRRRSASAHRRMLGMRSQRRDPYRFGVDFPLFRPSLLRGSASPYTPLGEGRGPTLPVKAQQRLRPNCASAFPCASFGDWLTYPNAILHSSGCQLSFCYIRTDSAR